MDRFRGALHCLSKRFTYVGPLSQIEWSQHRFTALVTQLVSSSLPFEEKQASDLQAMRRSLESAGRAGVGSI